MTSILSPANTHAALNSGTSSTADPTQPLNLTRPLVSLSSYSAPRRPRSVSMSDSSAVLLKRNSPQDASTSITASPRCLHRTDKQSLNYALRSAIAGGAAGCAAKTLIAPLDRVKILFQASNPQFVKYTGSWSGFLLAVHDIRRTDGIAGLFRGHSATLLRIFPYAAVKFVAYEQFRSLLIRDALQEVGWRRFLAGSLAGVTSVFCTYPLEVMRVRLAFDTRPRGGTGLRGICRTILREPHTSYPVLGGMSNFYRGFSPTVLGMLPYAGMSFLTHDVVRDWLASPALASWTLDKDSKPGKRRFKAWAELASGGIAGAASQTVSYPLEVIRRRMQVGGAMGQMRFPGIRETAVTIWTENGLRGFFVGLSIGYVKVIPMVATSFFVYERMKIYLDIT